MSRLKSGNIEQFKDLSQFDNLKSFNSSIEQWMIDYKSEFTKGELIALKRLIRFCAKVYGVSNAKIQSIVSATHIDSVGISRSTFKRMLLKAQEMNLITIHHTFNHGKQGHSVYVFNDYKSKREANLNSLCDTVEPLQQEEIEPPKTSNLSKTNNHNINTYKDNVIPNVPVEFQNLAKCYYSPKQVLELWKCVKHSTQHYNDFAGQYVDYDPNIDKVELAISSFKQMIVNIKLGYKIKKSIFSYFYGIIQHKLDNQFKDWKLNFL